MFHHRVISGVYHVVSGGGGAALYAAADEGGYYHFTLCRPAAEGLKVEPGTEAPPRSGELVVIGPGDFIFSPDDLDGLVVLEKELFSEPAGNLPVKVFTGVPVSVLIERAGGWSPAIP